MMQKIVVVLVVLVSFAMAPVAGAAEPTLQDPETKEAFLEWVKTAMPLSSPSGKALWSGILNVRPGSKPLGMTNSQVWASMAMLVNVQVSEELTLQGAKIVMRKEVVGHLQFLDWYYSGDNQSFCNRKEECFVTLFDGMAANYLAQEVGQLYPDLRFVPWDGQSQPDCQHLEAVQVLYLFKILAGQGVQNLLDEHCQ